MPLKLSQVNALRINQFCYSKDQSVKFLQKLLRIGYFEILTQFFELVILDLSFQNTLCVSYLQSNPVLIGQLIRKQYL